MAKRPEVLRADWLLPAPNRAAIRHGAILVRDGRIAASGPAASVEIPEGAAVTELGAAVLMPGLINAHQHGRGISQIMMGYPDMPLEPWIAGRRRHGPPDIGAVTRLAAEAMIANGVTATLHANYTYGTGDYGQELRDQIAAYRTAGLRATICVGLQDRGALIYPDADESAFAARLPKAAQALIARPASAPYMPDWKSSVSFMDRVQAEVTGDPLIRLAWGPAGPQWVSDTLWSQVAADARARNVGLHFHLLESPAQAASARRLYPEGTLARLRRLGVFNAATSCAHGVHMSPADMAIAAAEGLVVVLNPGSNLRLFNGPPPVAALRAAGVLLAAGTDNCAASDDEDYLAELWLATLLGRAEGAMNTAGQDAAMAFAIATTGGAAAAFLPEDHGVIAPGAPADVAAFRLMGCDSRQSSDPHRIAEMLFSRGRGRDCVLTMIAGQIRFAARPEDAVRLQQAHDRALASVRARANAASATGVAAFQAALRAHYAGRGDG